MYFFYLVIFVLIVKNIFLNKSSLFTILTNLIMLLLCSLPYVINLFGEDAGTVVNWYDNYLKILSGVLFVFSVILCVKYKMIKNTFIWLIYIIWSNFILNFDTSIYDIADSTDSYCNEEALRIFKGMFLCLMLQINLFVDIINANKDRFKKKSAEILDSKE